MKTKQQKLGFRMMPVFQWSLLKYWKVGFSNWQRVGADVNQKLFRGFAITAAVREGHREILEILLKAGASQPACEEALLEAGFHGRARLAELLMGSDLIRPRVAVHVLVTACCRGFADVVGTLLEVNHLFADSCLLYNYIFKLQSKLLLQRNVNGCY